MLLNYICYFCFVLFCVFVTVICILYYITFVIIIFLLIINYIFIIIKLNCFNKNFDITIIIGLLFEIMVYVDMILLFKDLYNIIIYNQNY